MAKSTLSVIKENLETMLSSDGNSMAVSTMNATLLSKRAIVYFYHEADGGILHFKLNDGNVPKGIEREYLESAYLVDTSFLPSRISKVLFDRRTPSEGKINLYLTAKRYNLEKGFPEKDSMPTTGLIGII